MRDEKDADKPKLTAAQQQTERLVELGEEHLALHTGGQFGAPYATERGSTVRRSFRTRDGVRPVLARIYRDAESRIPSDYAMRAALEVLAETARSRGPDPDAAPEPEAVPEQPAEPVKSVATQLVEMALADYELGCTPDGEPYGVPRTGPPIVRQLRGGRQSLRAELAQAFYRETGAAAAQSALADACVVLEGMAQQLEPVELHLRVARLGDLGLVLDLGDTTGRAVVIGAGGWQIVEQSPVLFRRTALTGALPAPETGCKLDELWTLLNVDTDHQAVLAGVLMAELIPDIPHPVVALLGEQGTGKTSAAKLLASVVDPSTPQVRKAPKDGDTWVTAASGSWVVALDNLSGLPDWLSDALCRASTGDGDVRRRLYSDGDLHVIAFRRAVIVNGIDLGAVRDDLADRLVTLDLVRIPDADRKRDGHLAAAWREAHPKVLGALLDLAAAVLAALPDVHLDELPRMADFALVLAAVDKVLDTAGLATYLGQRSDLAADAVTSDPVLVEITRAVAAKWTGTAAELLDRITPDDEKWRAPKGWPTKPRELTTVLKRRAPSLRRLGWTVDEDGHDSKSRAVKWRIAPPEQRGSENDARDARVTRVDSDTPSDTSDTSGESGPSLFVPPRPAGKCSLCGLTVPGPFDPDGRCTHCSPTPVTTGHTS